MRKLHKSTATAALCLLLAVSCQEKIVIDSCGLSIKTEEAESTASNQWLKVEASGAWTLDLAQESGEDVTWAFLGTAREASLTGSGNANVLLSWTENTDEFPRSCEAVLTTGGKTYECWFTQKASTSNQTVSGDEFKGEAVPSWMELPEVTKSDDLYFVTHDMTLASGKSSRNYAFLFDAENHISRWVAYPLNKTLIGSGSRHFSGTTYWVGTIDPKVPRAYQAVIETPFSGYQRGHQIPSADRLTSDANFETFYGTNMTPQLGSLNSYAWASLEGMVRSWANSFDTLYVVTGADVSELKGYSKDNDGKSIAVPGGYFKAHLGYRKGGTFGITGKTGGYTGIGFYFDHKDYGSGNSATVMGCSMTIDALESKLGYDFFPNLSSKTTMADYVESTEDSWWN